MVEEAGPARGLALGWGHRPMFSATSGKQRFLGAILCFGLHEQKGMGCAGVAGRWRRPRCVSAGLQEWLVLFHLHGAHCLRAARLSVDAMTGDCVWCRQGELQSEGGTSGCL